MTTKRGNKNDPYALYVLRDPFTHKIKYIGITSNIKQRKYDHSTSDYPNWKVETWKVELRQKGTKPIFEVIKTFESYIIAHSMEIKLIKSLSCEELLNINHKV